MTTEQLQMILDALQSMGAGGKEVILWWLLADRVLPVFVALALIVAVYRVAMYFIVATKRVDLMEETLYQIGNAVYSAAHESEHHGRLTGTYYRHYTTDPTESTRLISTLRNVLRGKS